MSTYTARIIIEGGTDLTVELDEAERQKILITAYQAKIRAQEARARADASRIADDIAAAFRRVNDSMPRWARGFSGDTIFTATEPDYAGPGRFRPQRPREPSRPNTPVDVNTALGVLAHFIGGDTQMFSGPDVIRRHVRKAKRIAHPDTGGSSADFQLVTAAEDVLRRAGRI